MRLVGLYSILIGGCCALILSGILAYQRTAPSTAMWLFFTAHQGDNAEIYRLHLGTLQQTNISRHPGVDTLDGISEDGARLFFTSDRANTGSLDMHWMDWLGNHVERTAPLNINFQRISPDKQWYVEVTNIDGNLEIVVRGRYTGEVRQITHNTIPDFEPAWSSDSKQLAYVSTYYNNADIYIMQPDGSQRKRVTTAPYPENNPIWSPLIDYVWHSTNWLLGSLVTIVITLLSNILWRRWIG